MAEEKDNGEKKSKAGEEGKNDEKKNGPNAVVLKVDLHCEGCASKIIKCAKAFEGVEKVRVEWEASKLTVEGKVDPAKLRQRLQEKTKKKVELISPQPNKNNNPNNNTDSSKCQEKKADEKKPKELPVTTAFLKLRLHCHGCVQKIHKFISKTSGVKCVMIEMQKDLVMVTGSIDVKALAEALKGRMKREVEIVPPKKEKEKGSNNEEKDGSGNGGGGGNEKEGGGNGNGNGNVGGKNGGGGGGKGGDGGNAGIIKCEDNCYGRMEGSRMEYYGRVGHPANTGYWYMYGENVHAPQYFSDENPNACTVM